MTEDKKEIKDEELKNVAGGGLPYLYEKQDYGDLSPAAFQHHLGERINVHTSSWFGHDFSDEGTVTKLGKLDYLDGTTLKCTKMIYIDTGEYDTTYWFRDDYVGKLWREQYCRDEIYVDVVAKL